jgi:hypothetical protein
MKMSSMGKRLRVIMLAMDFSRFAKKFYQSVIIGQVKIQFERIVLLVHCCQCFGLRLVKWCNFICASTIELIRDINSQ